MADKRMIIPWIMAGILAIVAITALSVAVVQCRTTGFAKQGQAAEAAAESAKEEAYREILETPAGDLVAGSPQAESLRGARDKLVDEFSTDAADRIGEILSRYHSEGTP